jgi:hypothetical protein
VRQQQAEGDHSTQQDAQPDVHENLNNDESGHENHSGQHSGKDGQADGNTSEFSTPLWPAIVGTTVALLALIAGAWYARRRWGR